MAAEDVSQQASRTVRVSGFSGGTHIEGLAIALHDLPEDWNGVDVARESPVRTQEPGAIHGKHPLQPAFELAQVA
jgi:hypothetical protein